MTVDYASAFDNCALYLPALNPQYASYAYNGTQTRNLPITPQDLNFLDPKNRLFFYPWALYSAGHAAPLDGTTAKLDIVGARDRSRTTIFADSGGYQVMTDQINFKGEETTVRLLRWMEQNADYSMALDFPTGGIARGVMGQHAERLEREGYGLKAQAGSEDTFSLEVTGGTWRPVPAAASLIPQHYLGDMCAANGQSKEFNACLMQTMINNDVYVRHHTPGATQFVNVLHGRNDTESKTWFEAVRHYPFTSWAFGSGHRTNLSLLLSRIIDMRDEGMLDEFDWLHIFGISQLEFACLYSTLQQCIRLHVNPRFQISFDSAGPFISAGKFQAYAGCNLSPEGWTVFTVHAADFSQIGSQTNFYDFLVNTSRFRTLAGGGQGYARALPTTISQMLKMGDICVSRVNSAAWEGESVHLVTNHNVQAHIRAIREAYNVYFSADQRAVPDRVQFVREMIKQVFTHKSPREFIEECRPWLDDYAVSC